MRRFPVYAFVACVIVALAIALAQPLPPVTTPWSRDFLRQTNGSVALSDLTATNGVVSLSANQQRATVVTPGGSPWSFTNSLAGGTGGTNNIQVFIQGPSVTGTISYNGIQIFNVFVNQTVILQPGEWITLSWTAGTPGLMWKNF